MLFVASCIYLFALFMGCPRIVNGVEAGLFILQILTALYSFGQFLSTFCQVANF